MTSTDAWDAVIVAGGAGRRLGGVSKPALVIAGETLLDRTLAATRAARSRVVVGGPRAKGVAWTVEDPPGSGPAAALGAGILALGRDASPWTVVLGVDTPRAADAVPALLAARAGDGAWLVDAEGRAQPLLAVYRTEALRMALAGGELANASLRSVLGALNMAKVPDALGAARDLDTWEDARYWEAVLA